MTDLTPITLRSTRTVKGVQLTDEADWEAIAEWCGGELRNEAFVPGSDPETILSFPRYAGSATIEEARLNDWVLKERDEDGDDVFSSVAAWNVGTDLADDEVWWTAQ